MNISYNWLKRYLDTDLSAEQLAVILTDIGLEVEGLEKIEGVRGGLEGVVVGEVLTCEDHPDSDHLHITRVDVGEGEPLPIVCGAANLPAGSQGTLREGRSGALPRRCGARSSGSSAVKYAASSRSACSAPRTNWGWGFPTTGSWSCPPTPYRGRLRATFWVSRTTTSS